MSPLAYLTWILALGVCAQWLAWRFKLPSILLLLGFGFAFGQITGVRVDDFLAEGDGHASPLLSVVGLLVAIILFEGGLTLRFRELREAGLPILRLCTLAVVLSLSLTTVFMTWVLGYDVRIAALIGAILTVTGPTVIAPLLRHVNPTKRMASIVKWEGIVVDPIGAILAVLVFKVAMAGSMEAAWPELLRSVVVMVAVGVVGAILLAKGVEWLLKRHLVPDYLQPVFLLVLVAVAFTLSNLVEKEAGLLTVTVLGVALANQRTVSVGHILEFKENLRTLIISTLFLILSGRIAPSDLGETFWHGVMLLGFLIGIGRPVSVLGALVGSKRTTIRERAFLAFMAPRGIVAAAVTSVFALEFEEAAAHGKFGPEISGVVAEQSEQLVALVFLVIVGTVLVYGLLATPLARRLGLASASSDGILFAGADEWARQAAKALRDEGHQVMMLDLNYRNVSAARMLGLEAHRANVLSEFAEEELDFNGLGHLIAGTPNDEVNSIAAQRFIHQFGRAGVWQIAAGDRGEGHRKAASDEVRGKICFTGEPTFDELRKRAAADPQVKKVKITDVFGWDQFQEANPEGVVLFVEDSKGLRPAPGVLEKVSEGTAVYVL